MENGIILFVGGVVFGIYCGWLLINAVNHHKVKGEECLSKLIAISKTGCIQVLGIPFGIPIKEAKALLEFRGFSIKGSSVNISIWKTSISKSLPKVSVYFIQGGVTTLKKDTSSKGGITSVLIGRGGITEREADKLFRAFRQLFRGHFVEDKTDGVSSFENTLYQVKVVKIKKGDLYYSSVKIEAKYLSAPQYVIEEYYQDCETISKCNDLTKK